MVSWLEATSKYTNTTEIIASLVEYLDRDSEYKIHHQIQIGSL